MGGQERPQHHLAAEKFHVEFVSSVSCPIVDLVLNVLVEEPRVSKKYVSRKFAEIRYGRLNEVMDSL